MEINLMVCKYIWTDKIFRWNVYLWYHIQTSNVLGFCKYLQGDVRMRCYNASSENHFQKPF